jgi:hypothetical protein
VKPFTDGSIGPGWKLAWLDAIARDLPNGEGAALAVAIIIAGRVDERGCSKTITQPWIATRLGISLRTVKAGFSRLVGRGHLEVLRPARGRGQANELRIVRKPKLPERVQDTAPQNPMESVQDSVNKRAEYRQEGCEILPTLPIIYSDSYPSEPPTSDRAWETVLTRLSQPNRLGVEIVQAWLSNGKMQLGHIENGNLSLVAKSEFLANYVAQKYEQHLLQEWKRIDPTIERLEIKHGAIERTPTDNVAPGPQKVISLRDRLKAKAVSVAAPRSNDPATGNP